MPVNNSISALGVAALHYGSNGWYVVPIHAVNGGQCSCRNPRCQSPGKHPRVTAWRQTASRDPAQIRDWWGEWPGSNVGVVCGARSRLAVVDVDPRNHGHYSLDALLQTYGPLPATVQALTGGAGWHHYFALDAPLGKFDPAPGINLQADGALVVAPPSRHASGRTYEWEASSDPADVALAPLPAWLRAMGEARDTTPGAGVELPRVLPAVRLQDLRVSPRVQALILTGTDPDDPSRYCYPGGTLDRSRALFAAIQALIAAGHDDGTIAAVVTDTRYAISAKVLSQHDPRNVRYAEQTRRWVAQEIARARAKQPPARPPLPGLRATLPRLRPTLRRL